MTKTLLAYLRLMRPANIMTAIADILLGFAISGSVVNLFTINNLEALPYLILSTIGLYGGGVVFNDVFDYELDKVERPERALPSGEASLLGAIILGGVLLIMGVLSAFQVSRFSGSIAISLVVLVLLYDSFSKHYVFTGPLNMGLCRGFNLMLGISVVPMMAGNYWHLMLIPIIYIAAITLVSQGEVRGGNLAALRMALIMYILVFGFIISLYFLTSFKILLSLPFLTLFAFLIFPPLLKAMQDLQAKNVFRAVKAGVLALVVMDAAIAAGFAGWEYALVILTLLPISIFLGKLFSVS